MVRNGQHQAREATTAAGVGQCGRPRVKDKRIDEEPCDFEGVIDMEQHPVPRG